MGSPMVCLHFIFKLVILKGQCQAHLDFEGLYDINETRLAIYY